MSVFYGDWVEVHAWMNGMKMAPLEPFTDKVEALGKAIQKKLRQHVIDQDISWVPLSHSTIRQKGFDTIYIHTGEYLRKIDFDILKDSMDVWELIVYPKGDHDASGLSMQTLGMYLEFGTARMPERPLWRVVYEEVEGLPEFKALTG